VETLAELQTDVIGATPRWRDARAAQAFTAIPGGAIDPTADVLSAPLAGAALPAGAQFGPPMPAVLLDFTALCDRMVAPPRQPVDEPGAVVLTEPLQDTDGGLRAVP
jgi:hypothetical protein